MAIQTKRRNKEMQLIVAILNQIKYVHSFRYKKGSTNELAFMMICYDVAIFLASLYCMLVSRFIQKSAWEKIFLSEGGI